ncbi:MAG: UDP-N-acetylmuramate dehydrogenase [Halieaceae bacterium]|jgi:UDP-N-acetylmuramate dehydrogenase
MTVSIEHNIELSAFNTLGVPCRAGSFCNVYSREQAIEAAEYATNKNLAVLTLGLGTNVVLSADWPGLVIRQRSSGWETLEEDDERVVLKVAAGENWHQFVHECLTRGFFGLENLALIPGTVGGAPIQNIGAYGTEVSETIREVSVVNLDDLSTTTLTNAECNFSYRESEFKQSLKDRVIITDVTFELSKEKILSLDFPALFEYFQNVEPATIDPWAIFNAVVEIRSAKLPDPGVVPNVGSFFKNPTTSRTRVEELLRLYADMPVFDSGTDRFKIPAAWLIERCGWKGKELLGIAMHDKHALVLVNPEGRTGTEILEFARKVADSVYRKFDIALELEPVVYP